MTVLCCAKFCIHAASLTTRAQNVPLSLYVSTMFRKTHEFADVGHI